MVKVSLDFETRSACDIGLGVYRYAEDPSTSVWLFAYRFGDEPVQLWRPGDGAPDQLLAHVAAGGALGAFNANFERQIWNHVLRRPFPQWPQLMIPQMDCSQSRALAVHLPADLDTLAQVLKLRNSKDKEGSKLMRKMAKPRKRLPDGSFVWWDEPSNIERLGQYCIQDVIVECEADKILPPLSPDERELWELDQVINDRGIRIDVHTATKITEVLEVAQERANVKMAALTNNAVGAVTQVTRIVAWLQSRGFPAQKLAKDDMPDLIEYAKLLGDDEALAVLKLRQETGKSSTAKFQKMIDVVGDDGRARGLLAYHRASTGRWGGALLQPQNMPRVDEDTELPDVLAAVEMLQ